jgi:hypothetical protein
VSVSILAYPCRRSSPAPSRILKVDGHDGHHAASLDSSVGRASGGVGGASGDGVDLVGDNSAVVVLVAVDIVEPGLEEGADEAGQAGTHISTTNKQWVGRLQSEESKSRKRLLDRVVAEVGGVVSGPATRVVLGGEDEGGQPEVGHDPVEGCGVALVLVESGDGHEGEVEENADGALTLC